MLGGNSREGFSIHHWDEDMDMDNVLKRKRHFDDSSRPETSKESKLPKSNNYAIEKQSVQLMISSLFDVLKENLQPRGPKKTKDIEDCQNGVLDVINTIFESFVCKDVPVVNKETFPLEKISCIISNKIEETVSKLFSQNSTTNVNKTSDIQTPNFASILANTKNCSTIVPPQPTHLKANLNTMSKFHVGIKFSKNNPDFEINHIKNLIKPLIKQEQLNIKITNTNSRTKEKFIVHVDSLNSQETLYKELMKHSKTILSEYTIYKASPPLTRITILGVDNDITNDEIISNISNLACNNLASSSEVKITRRTKPINGKINVLLFAPRSTGSKLIELGRIFLGLEGCKIIEGIYVKQCFNCFGFNHVSSDCKAPSICNRCHGPHSTRDCTLNDRKHYKCANCILYKHDDVNHSATSFSCPIFKEKNETERQKNQYEIC